MIIQIRKGIAVLCLFKVITLKGNIVNHIKTLDYMICKAIEHPTVEGAGNLSFNLLQLFIALDETHDMLRDEREAGKALVQQLLDSGGLKLLRVKPNFPYIMDIFNWSVDESKVLGVTIKDTVRLWKDIKIGIKIIPTTEIDYALNPDRGK